MAYTDDRAGFERNGTSERGRDLNRAPAHKSPTRRDVSAPWFAPLKEVQCEEQTDGIQVPKAQSLATWTTRSTPLASRSHWLERTSYAVFSLSFQLLPPLAPHLARCGAVAVALPSLWFCVRRCTQPAFNHHSGVYVVSPVPKNACRFCFERLVFEVVRFIMSGLELGLAIVATVELCLKYGRNLVDLCAAFKNAETAIAHRILRVKQSWTRTSYHLDFLRRAAEILPPEYQLLQKQTLEALREKLETTITMLDSMAKVESPMHDQIQQILRVRRWKYARSEEKLNKAIDDLETWQGIFDPSWYLIIKAAIPQVDEELARHAEGPARKAISTTHSLKHALNSGAQNLPPIWLPEDGLAKNTIVNIPFSPARVAQRRNASRDLILESISVPTNANITVLTKDIREFARKLSHADPVTFGLLNCKGVVKHFEQNAPHPSSFTFVFRMPDGYSNPTSLRSLLIEGNIDHSLSDRFIIASQLAKSVGYIHTFDFVHKNVRPENILMLKPQAGSMEHAYLVGFEQIRTAERDTSRIGDTAWEKNLYRHPRRQGETPTEKYIMQHDIYSLGVCLLELGLWQSFVDYEQGDLGSKTPRPSSALQLSPEITELEQISLIKDHLRSLARRALPRRMGTKYADIVETCLTCLDPDNTDFGDEREFQDSDGILVGVRYIEKILMQLSTISV